MNSRIKLLIRDSIFDFDSKLKEIYKANIFDFAYFLAIALNDDFLPHEQERSEINKNRMTFKKSINNLKKIRKTIESDVKLEELKKAIEKNLQHMEEMALHFQGKKGRTLTEKAKLVLLWSQLIRKDREKPLKSPFVLGNKTFPHKIITEIDWNDFYTILRWFFKKIETCSYAHLIQPKQKKEEEKNFLKSSLQQNTPDYERSACHEIQSYQSTQRYFKYKEKSLPDKCRKDKINSEPITFLYVRFTLDSIEIVERRKDGIFSRKVKFIDKKKQSSNPEKIMLNPKFQKPSVCFPDGESIDIKNYTPPLFPSQVLIDKHIHDFMVELRKMKNK